MASHVLDSRRGRLRLFITLGALSAFGPMSLDMYLPAFPDIAESLNTQTSAVQMTFSAALMGLALGQLLYGPLADRYGRKRPLAIGMVLYIIASIACAFAPSLPILVALRFVQTLGGCAGIVIARATIRDLFNGTELAAALSAVSTVSVLAPVLAPAIGALILIFAPWQWVFVALALFGAGCLAAGMALPETLPPERRNAHGFVDAMRAYGQIARTRVFQVAALLAGTGSMALFSYVSSAPTVFIDGFGVAPAVFAIIFAVNSLFLSLGAQANIRFVRRFQAQRIIPIQVAVQFVCAFAILAAALLSAPMLFTLIPLAIFMMAFTGTQANTSAEMLRPFPQSAGSAAALGGVTGMGLAAVMTFILPTLHMSPRLAMGTGMATATAVGLLLALFLGRLLRQRTAGQAPH